MLTGIPLHPLLVHFAVVMTLAAGLAQLAALLSGRARRWLGWGLPVFAVLTGIVTRVAQSFGEILEESGTVRETAALHDHTEWGERAGMAALALGALSLLEWWLRRRGARAQAARTLDQAARRGGPAHAGVVAAPVSTAARVVGVLAGLAALAAIVLVTLAGHSGAVSVWR